MQNIETWKDSGTPNEDIMYSSHLKTMQRKCIPKGSLQSRVE